jgi:hypothetical protein
MPIKTIDDIEEEKRKDNREKMKTEISEDINDVIGNVFGKPKKRKKTWVDRFFSILKIIGLLLIIVVIIDIVLGSVWLLKFFIKSLFFGG